MGIACFVHDFVDFFKISIAEFCGRHEFSSAVVALVDGLNKPQLSQMI